MGKAWDEIIAWPITLWIPGPTEWTQEDRLNQGPPVIETFIRTWWTQALLHLHHIMMQKSSKDPTSAKKFNKIEGLVKIRVTIRLISMSSWSNNMLSDQNVIKAYSIPAILWRMVVLEILSFKHDKAD